ncbi:carbohydrate-binding module family 20 protein [Xylariaceae sp. FL0255]|nr:carbohydrate-binding module family 20 protein [Xylariaceae sp. FL0255]
MRPSSQLAALAACSVASANLLSLDAFVERQRAISLQGALNNIGPNGSQSSGAASGVVIASPSTTNPDYLYTWVRDASLTMKMIVDEFVLGKRELQTYIEDFIHSQAVLQTVTNPSGTFLPSGVGLGEPKFNIDLTRFNGAWGRPQRDGPALRAIALITYSNWLISTGQKQKAKTIVWPIISNDLSYVGQYWNSTGFDLWEEVEGSSFFTTQNQYRALVQGSTLAKALDVTCTGCDQASNISCFLDQSFWNGEYFVANINVDNGRSGKDANTMLGSIAVFDVKAKCDDPSIQPCNSRALSSFKAWVDAFRNSTLYPINQGIPKSKGVAVGRYPEDIYYEGNPWYLITAGAAEFLYDAVAQWKTQSSLTIDVTSLPFFQGIYPAAQEKTYTPFSKSAEFIKIASAVTAYADSFLEVFEKYTPSNGSLSEQFNKTAPFKPGSARDLTWSYAAFVSMAEHRSGQFPPSWVPATYRTSSSSHCSSGSTKGVYAPAVAAGAPNITTSCTVNVQFEVNATTYYGENILVAGNTSDLGSWNLDDAWPLSANNYTSSRPLWYATVALTPGETINYAYVRQEDCNQAPIWENPTANRTLVVPACDPNSEDDPTAIAVSTNDTWDGPTGTSGDC